MKHYFIVVYLIILKLIFDRFQKIQDFNKTQKILKNFQGILVPGGFGKEGSSGKINAIKFAKTSNVPF